MNTQQTSTPQSELGLTKRSMRATTGDLTKFMKPSPKPDDLFNEIGLEASTPSGLR